MSNITDYLLQLQSLTKTNLEILQALNNSLYTKKNQTAVDVNGVTYAIPSFTSLENKINMLQENFENLVNSPNSGEAYFNFDGDSRSIEVRSYNHTPHRLSLTPVSEFGIHQNDIFKDFLTPVPYAHFNLESLPNDITSVNIKKIVPLSSNLIEVFSNALENESSKTFDYSSLYKILSAYAENVDYIEYNTVQKLPIRKNIGSATYVIEKIINDEVDVDLDEYITIKFRSDLPDYTSNLTYKLFDETICKNLKVGDQLVTFDSSAKMEVVKILSTTNTIVVKLLHGEYLNLVESGSDTKISDYSKLRFYSPTDFDSDKYIQVPLEEDQYVFIAIAALNDRMNIQGPWGTGVIINTDLLVNGDLDFRTYYNNNVRNVGDVLFEITSMMSNTLTKYSKEEYQKFTNAIPVINKDYIQVTQINKHLNDSTTIKNIRSLYSQKKNDKTLLNEVQAKIDEINEKLATISFDDTSNLRAAYTASLIEYNTRKNELVTSISKTVAAISVAANDAEVPIESAKYRIRGFFDVNEFAKSININPDHICGIQVQYRYKNVDQEQGTAMSIGGKDGESLFIFSDWNIMDSFINPRVSDFKTGYKFAPKEYNGNINEPSFNQIDIPISQGETVDIRMKVIYDYGRPFVETHSSWSEIINIPFPTEYLKDIQVIDIIKENNNDIETNRFAQIIEQKGIPNHINDKLIDQDITYYHKPESIASGFYTDERRIIPLKDKLESMNTSIQELKDEVMGTTADSLIINVVNGEVINRINPFQDNPITLEAYSEIGDVTDGVYKLNKDTGVVSTILNLVIKNDSEHTAKIYSMFPGSRDTILNDLSKGDEYKYPTYKYHLDEYCTYVVGENDDSNTGGGNDNNTGGDNDNNTGGDNDNNTGGDNDNNTGGGDSNTGNTGNDIIINHANLRDGRVYYNLELRTTTGDEIVELTVELRTSPDINDIPISSGSTSIRVNSNTMTYPSIGEDAFLDARGNKDLWIFVRADYGTGPVQRSQFVHIDTGSRSLLTVDSSKISRSVNANNTIPDDAKEGDGGVWIYNQKDNKFKLQSCNQILTFRIKDPYTLGNIYCYGNPHLNGEWELDDVAGKKKLDKLSSDLGENNKYQQLVTKPSYHAMTMYPIIRDKYSICLDSNLVRTYFTMAPRSEIIVPVMVEYYFDKSKIDKLSQLTKTMSFDIRTSLYQDPINYTFSVTTKYTATTQDKLISTTRRSYGLTDASNRGWIKYNSSEVK